MRSIHQPLINGLKKCSCCGNRLLQQGYRELNRLSQLMDRHKICYECAFWKEIIDYPPEDYHIVGNRCMKIGEWVDNYDSSMTLGSRGKVRYFVTKDNQVFKSNDVWIVGTVPERFRDILKPTLQEIPRKIHDKLKKHNKRCLAKGCLDRYHCFRYDASKEKTPHNKIPYNWKPGGEKCRDFLNRNEIITDESNIIRKIKIKGYEQR